MPPAPTDSVSDKADPMDRFLAELEGFQDDLEQEMVRHLSDPQALGISSGPIARRKELVQDQIQRLSQDVADDQPEVLFRLAEAVEARSKETGSHVMRVAGLCYVLGKKCGLGEAEAELLRLAVPMHDVGKVGIPDAILHKPGGLTPEEMSIMQCHTTIGYQMLRGSQRRILRAAAIVALQHHENYDGQGYPLGLAGDKICLYGRITCLVDVFDALSFDRVYRKAWSLDRILHFLRDERGKMFDPGLVDLFMANLSDLLAVRDAFPADGGTAEEAEERLRALGRGHLAALVDIPGQGPDSSSPACEEWTAAPNIRASWRGQRDPRDSPCPAPAVRALVAEADPLRSVVIHQVLHAQGYQTVSAVDGARALQMLQDRTGPRLAVLGWDLPVMTGAQICRHLRRLHGEQYVYVILVTGKACPGRIVEGMQAGADACVPAPIEAARLDAQLAAAKRILELQAEILGARESLREQATRDGLTGLWNRPAILDILRNELSRAVREDTSLGVIMSDVDHFKAINDTYGHRIGDAVLREVSARLRLAIRPYDMTGRYGGEEFISIIPGCNATFAGYAAERLRHAVAAEPVVVDGKSIPVTMSFGAAAQHGLDDVEGEALIQAADLALYDAKRSGRNRLAIAEDLTPDRPSQTASPPVP